MRWAPDAAGALVLTVLLVLLMSLEHHIQGDAIMARVIEVAQHVTHQGFRLVGTPQGLGVREADPRDQALAEVRARLARLRTTPTVRSEAERWCRDALAQGRTVEESVSAAMSAAVALDQGYEVEDTA